MCLSPNLVKNPNHNVYVQHSSLSSFYDWQSEYIVVPCGRCPVCLALKQSYLVQRVQMESLDNIIFFGMLSYNPETLPSIDVNGYNIKYADIRHFQDMIRYIRSHEDLPKFRYFACTERGGKRHRPHFHFMIFYPKSSIHTDYTRIKDFHLMDLQSKLWDIFLKYWRHNVGCRKFPVWEPNLTYRQLGNKRNYDFQFVDTISSDCSDSAFYITKYSTKFDDYEDKLKSAIRLNTSEEEFKQIWQKVKSRYLMSKGFGNIYSKKVYDHIRKGIDYSLSNKDCFYPVYFSPFSGQQFPLSPYLRSKFLHASESLVFKERILSMSSTGVISDAELSDPLTPDLIERKFYDFKKLQEHVSKRDQDLSQGFDYLSLEDYNNSKLILTDDQYGKISRLSQEDFELTLDW